MASTKREPGSSVSEDLFRHFYSYSFFKAVDLLEKSRPEKKKLGQAGIPSQEPVRFTVSPGFSFPPSDIRNLKEMPGGKVPEMDVAFLGLIGPSGLLPNWYNELAANRVRKRDTALVDFLNIFHHRLITLFYLAWKKHRFPENYQAGAGDRLSRYVLCLAGLGTHEMVRILGLPREALTFYSGLLSLPVASAMTIEAAVEYFSGASTRVDPFVEREVELEDSDRTCIGRNNACIGVDAVCGSLVRECQTKFRVNLGPVGYRMFLRLLPRGDLLLPVFSLIRYMVGIEFEFEIRIHLKKEDVPPCILGDNPIHTQRLGWSSWIASPGYCYPGDEHVTFQEYDLQKAKESTMNEGEPHVRVEP